MSIPVLGISEYFPPSIDTRQHHSQQLHPCVESHWRRTDCRSLVASDLEHDWTQESSSYHLSNDIKIKDYGVYVVVVVGVVKWCKSSCSCYLSSIPWKPHLLLSISSKIIIKRKQHIQSNYLHYYNYLFYFYNEHSMHYYLYFSITWTDTNSYHWSRMHQWHLTSLLVTFRNPKAIV